MRFWRFVQDLVKCTIRDQRARHRRDFERNLIYSEYKPKVLGNKIKR